jgi:uncharacterized membrane-anchored protein YitT (DUF2179 family)
MILQVFLKSKISNIQENKKIKIIIDYIILTIGSYIISFGINIFLLPNKLTTGGASGIATIFYYLSSIPLGITIIIINLPLFLTSIIKLGREFSIKTIYGTLILATFLDDIKYNNLDFFGNLDLFTSCIFGGIIVGIGLSLVFKAGASTGGSDLLAQIIYKTTSIQSLSQILFVIELVIISSIMIVFKNINIGLYSIIAMFISSKVIDIVFVGIFYTKVATIITKNPENIVNGILKEIKRGATITETKGAHSMENNTTITCLITRPQIAKLKNVIKRNDKNAIMYISTASEVIGKGFKSIE